jgi:hypothetical protein
MPFLHRANNLTSNINSKGGSKIDSSSQHSLFLQPLFRNTLYSFTFAAWLLIECRLAPPRRRLTLMSGKGLHRTQSNELRLTESALNPNPLMRNESSFCKKILAAAATVTSGTAILQYRRVGIEDRQTKHERKGDI